MGAKRTIGMSLPNNSIILSNQISGASFGAMPLKGGLQRTKFISSFHSLSYGLQLKKSILASALELGSISIASATNSTSETSWNLVLRKFALSACSWVNFSSSARSLTQ
ncbi:7113_t:CDS:2 [Funneliformis geosporum]|nr:7113_t:CDS:2 [Funneliformis geosporum]